MLKRLAALPRDARDTLFLLVVIAWVVMPQVGNLPLWCSGLAAAVLVWRGWLALRGRPLPGRLWRVGLLLATIAATLATHRTLLGRDAGVTLIVVLLALKTLELRARRDAFVVFFLGFFTMLTNFFFSQSLLTAAAMLVALLGLLTALVNAHLPVGRPSLWTAASLAGRMALLGAPIMAVLFMLFPRLAPLWGIPSDAMSGRSGLSAVMQVGNVASLALDDSIALRVRFEGTPPPQSLLYFRGPVLTRFDGREWRAPRPEAFDPRAGARAQLAVSGPATRYEVTLEPSNRPWLFVLDATPRAPVAPGLQAAMTPELQWLTNRPVTDLLRYRAESHVAFSYGPQRASRQTLLELQDALDLPPGYNPRTLQLAMDLRRDPRWRDADAPALVDVVLERLRTGGYTYTLEPGVAGTHTADEFWFDTKAGFCEHIASAFVILMRALDVPARVVTGYQGGAQNRLDGYWTVRQSDAHAWAEVWIAGRGWVRVDPTSAVAPGRTGTLQRLVPRPGPVAAMVMNVSPDLAAQLRAAWEAVNNRWNQWVLNYTQSRQLDLLRHLGFESPSWEDLGYVLAALLSLASLAGAAWAWWDRRQHDPWLRLLARARARLRAAGLPVAPQAGPRELARALAQAPGDPAATAPVRDWLLRLEHWRYAPHVADHPRVRLATLAREYARLPWPTR